jgi:general secretion pathway protein C
MPLSRSFLSAGSSLHRLQLQLQSLGRWLAGVGLRRWQQLVLLVAALWLVWNLARIVWLLMPWPVPTLSTAVPVNVAQAGGAQLSARSVDIEAMIAWKLFGDAGESAMAPPAVLTAVEEAAQESSLNLKLQGVMSAEEPALARALILADGRQQQFAVGDRLPASGQVTLRRVMPDRIVIDNNGRAETIWLYDDPAAMRALPRQSTSMARTVDLRGDAEVTAAAAGYREQLFNDPASLSDVLQVSVERDGGRMVGYRVRPGRDTEQFERFGFKPGDVVIAINGVGLEDPQRALELYNQMRSATDATFTVRRGDEELTLVVALNPVSR